MGKFHLIGAQHRCVSPEHGKFHLNMGKFHLELDLVLNMGKFHRIGAYWISVNITIAILNFSLLLPL